eukprot:gnl/TRDRNA2_/TRDRNA2_151971_c0_seq1.p1 gnl/TRDRNA2_/TRDRNA2_151971_c0~~gnl/TRDRNA2_/TRDRNA2_151971_c0_seq1.p1  ORF type:complete len:426 (+),score=67.89 gnl/TRDRNA2_/TRDRNA2_151971_c0_seq1:132-1280(+)
MPEEPFEDDGAPCNVEVSKDGDVPCVRDLLIQHFEDPDLEVEGKLGRRTDRRSFRDKFTAGVTAEQFAALEARLNGGASFLGLPPRATMPELEETLDRFHAPTEGTACARESRCTQYSMRSSFACDGSGLPADKPLEVLLKTRLVDCHVAPAPRDRSAPPPPSPVAIRVSFSREAPGFLVADGAPPIYERRKRRRTWQASLWSVQLTRVTVEEREVFEVEVELRMEAVRARLMDPVRRADEALLITCELAAALRGLAAWASEVPPASRKRKRLEDFGVADVALKASLEAPEVAAELRRLVGQGTGALHQAKQYLCEVLRAQCPAVEESVLFRFAGKQVERALLRQRKASMEKDKSLAPDDAAADIQTPSDGAPVQDNRPDDL